MMKSGTLWPIVAALTLTSPLHSLLTLGQLITMASKKARRESLMAVDSLKDLFLNNLLPDEAKLRFFHQHPLRAAQNSPAHLVLWFFEHCLKTAYAQLKSWPLVWTTLWIATKGHICVQPTRQTGTRSCAAGYAGE
ncbi:hypothetical protein DVH05_028605 [Phytophthora capsici]|nr:hypothetical protein DVH05_028605 [Phytophthora capsici]